MRILHNLEQQIQARNQCVIAEDALNEFSMMFRHFDMDKTGKLNLNAIKSCLRALGVVQQLVQGDGRLPHCQDETILEPKNGQGITGTIVLFICFIRFLTFSLFEIIINYLSYKVWSELNVYLYYVTHNSKSIHLILTTLYLFLSQEPGITWSSPQDYFPKHLFNNWQLEKNTNCSSAIRDIALHCKVTTCGFKDKILVTLRISTDPSNISEPNVDRIS